MGSDKMSNELRVAVFNAVWNSTENERKRAVDAYFDHIKDLHNKEMEEKYQHADEMWSESIRILTAKAIDCVDYCVITRYDKN